jgi:hypothetical protein
MVPTLELRGCCFVGSLLEGVPRAGWVRIARNRLIQEMAEVNELALRSGSLGQRASLPLGNELLRCHAGQPNRYG